MNYKRADFEVLRRSDYGVCFHWTTDVMPLRGEKKTFGQAVEDFDVARFVEQVRQTGAGHVVFTSTHREHWLPGPNPEVDRIMPGRTCKRDLLMEIADALLKHGIKLVLYYHHGTDTAEQDPEWFRACGAGEPDGERFYDNYCRIVSEMGRHYGSKAVAFWFDAGYVLHARRNAPWERLTAAAKTGHPDRLVTYNAGIESMRCYTEFQDYWAGETNRINFYPRSESTPAGLPIYALTGWHPQTDPKLPQCGTWFLDADAIKYEYYPPALQSVIDYYERFKMVRGVVAFNLLIYQEGLIYPSDLEVMKRFADHVKNASGVSTDK